jgi:aerobic-type carbon monoxide dehydrogenase small subunit (CoxS/CutS family)
MITFQLDGRAVATARDDVTLLEVLREELGCVAVKDGCSPQGQCGCCTVLVDGNARVACVTPVRRVAGRSVVTIDGLSPDVRRTWATAFADVGASQCGFCTPGIILRLAALGGRRAPTEQDVRTALLAHLCRCTGWQTVVEAGCRVLDVPSAAATRTVTPDPSIGPAGGAGPGVARDPLLVAWRAEIEGRAAQAGGPEIALGGGRFADDLAPRDASVAMPSATGGYELGSTPGEARLTSGRVPGRNSTVGITHPLDAPEGEWLLTLQTTWVEPAYLEPDASWCVPGGVPASAVANGGAFGGKAAVAVTGAARALADERGQPCRVLWPREHVARWGPKRPPVAMGVRADGTGVVRVARTPGSAGLDVLAERIRLAAPGMVVELVPVAGPPVSADPRGAGWVEAAVLLAGARARRGGGVGPGTPVAITAPDGGRARAAVGPTGDVTLEVWAGECLDEVTLRSYCIGAAHQALGWVWSEGVAVDDEGAVLDLTIRSYGILNAREMPRVDVTVHPECRWPVNGSDAAFAAIAAAAWIAGGLPPHWPAGRQLPRASAEATPGTHPT